MGSAPPSPPDPAPPGPPSPAFLEMFRAHADDEGRMPFERFMALALYAPGVGYYRQPRARVGYGEGTDFFTASTSGPVFGELVAAAAAELVQAHGGRPDELTFVEIGAESGDGVLAGVAHPFAAARCVRLGEPAGLAGRCVVFSNELFDAQPCARYVRVDGGWAEVLVELVAGALRETLQAIEPPPDLPADAPLGYRFDAPRAAAALARQLAAEPWQGLFLAFDYGKNVAELEADTPAGTVRAYHRHRQSNDLLARPGEQDLTCHVCWDWLTAALRDNGFAVAPVRSQETFFITQAGAALSRMVAEGAAQLTRRKLSLMQLLHPAHLGRKFQVLSAWR